MGRISQQTKRAMPALEDQALATSSVDQATVNLCLNDVMALFKRNIGLTNLVFTTTLSGSTNTAAITDFSGANAVLVLATDAAASVTFMDIRTRNRQGAVISDAPEVGTTFTVVNAHSDALSATVNHGNTTSAGVESTQTTQVSGASSVSFVYTGQNNWARL